MRYGPEEVAAEEAAADYRSALGRERWLRRLLKVAEEACIAVELKKFVRQCRYQDVHN